MKTFPHIWNLYQKNCDTCFMQRTVLRSGETWITAGMGKKRHTITPEEVLDYYYRYGWDGLMDRIYGS